MSNTLQRQSPGNLGQLQDLLEKHKGQIATALPKHMTAERMIRVALSAVSGNSLLLQCRPITLAASIVQASILGLEPNSLLGEAYLIPFWNSKIEVNGKKVGGYDCQLMPGYLGLVKLARNSGQVSMIDAQAVHANDEFMFQKGSDTWWSHKWDRTGDRGEVQGYWAGYVLKDGAKNFEYWTVEQIERHRDKYSQGAYKKDRGVFVFDKDGNKILQGPWKDSPDWMYKKTPLKQVMKLMPKSIEMATAMAMDERIDAGVAQAYIDVPLSLQPPEDTSLIEGDVEEPAKPVVEEKPAAKGAGLTEKQQQRIISACAESKWTEKRLVAYVGALGFENLKDVPAGKLDEMLAEIAGVTV